MRKSIIFFIVIILHLYIPVVSEANEDTTGNIFFNNQSQYVNQLIEKVKISKIGYTKSWKKILFYRLHWGIIQKSLVDDKKFL